MIYIEEERGGTQIRVPPPSNDKHFSGVNWCNTTHTTKGGNKVNRGQWIITLQVILSILVALEIQNSERLWLMLAIISGVIALKHESDIINIGRKVIRSAHKIIKVSR